MPYTPKTKRIAAIPILNKTAFDYKINNEKRISSWISTLAIESGELKYQEEIASGKAYEGRKDLGNIFPGDGVKFKGRGRIQITGRDNYTAYTEYLRKSGHLPFVDFVKEPHKLAQEPYATDSAGWFFAIKIKANPLADRGEFLEIQLRVNGGRKRKPPRPNHWIERKTYYERALRVIEDDFLLEGHESIEIEAVNMTALENKEGYPDFDIHEESVGQSADPSVEPTDVAISEELGTPSSSDSSNISVKVDGDKVEVKAESTDQSQPKERVAVVKAKPEKWTNRVTTKVTAALTGNALFQWIWGQIEKIRGLEIPDIVWAIVSITIAIGTLLWIIHEIVSTHKSNTYKKEIDNLLVKENSTPDNLVQLINDDEVELFRRRGFRIITR